jgi:hypothetical protein
MRLGRKNKDAPPYDLSLALAEAHAYVTQHGKSQHHAQVAKKIEDAQKLADWVTLNDPIVYTEPEPEPESTEAP